MGLFRPFTTERKRRADIALAKAQAQLKLAQETLAVESQTKVVNKQISTMQVANEKLTAHQIKLIDKTNTQLIAAQKDGMELELAKSLPALLEARQSAGQKMIAGTFPAIQSVKDRAKS